jgi:hypothetical protein
MVALVEPPHFERKSKRGTIPVSNAMTDVVLLSVGSGNLPSMPYDANSLANAGLYGWAQHISDVMFQSQSELIHEQAKFFLGPKYFRINPKLDFPLVLDDAAKVIDLKNKMDVFSDYEPFLNVYFT